MSHSLRTAGLAGLLAAVLCISISWADEAKPPAGMPDAAAMDQMMADYAQVGPEHKHLQFLVGKWKAKVTSYCTDPKNPEISEGTAEFKSILGGRFVVERFETSFQGKPYEGFGVSGYDNALKKYVGNWIDNMGTGIMNTVGEVDEATQTMTQTGEMVLPMGPTKMKMVTKVVSNDEFTFTMYWLGPGDSENKVMEIDYTRQ